MIKVAQPTARPWDGQRILRFLTSLAMLALAVTLHLPAAALPAAVVAPAAVSVRAAAPPAAEITSPDPDTYEAERITPEPASVAAAAPATVTFTTRNPLGEIPGTTGSRAPPAV